MIQVMKGTWDANDNGYADERVVKSFPVSVEGLLSAMARMAYEDDSDSVVHIELFGEIMPMMPHDWVDEKRAKVELERSPAYQAYALRKLEQAALASVMGRARKSVKRSMAI